MNWKENDKGGKHLLIQKVMHHYDQQRRIFAPMEILLQKSEEKQGMKETNSMQNHFATIE